LLILVALLDVGIGLAFVVPRATESARPLLKAAFLGGAGLMLALGGAFLLGILPA
jgi:hypothetical protein